MTRTNTDFREKGEVRQPDDPLLGQRVGPYRIERLIGAGGMGSVYLGVDEALQRKAAVKVLSLLSPRWIARFINEARHQARLDHPNIVSVYGAGSDQVSGLEVHYIALKYIEGNTLSRLVREQGPFEPLQATELMLDAARGLYYVHSEGFVHRDVKPSNILVDLGERALISDFGVSWDQNQPGESLTSSEFLGTWTYASPEQIGRKTLDQRSDIYSLGATYLFALTGVELEEADTGTILSGTKERPIDPALPALVRYAVSQMLQFDPTHRFRTMLECIDSLERARRSLVGDGGSSGRPGSSATGERAPTRSRVWLQFGLSAVVLAVVALLIASALPDRQDEPVRAGGRAELLLVKSNDPQPDPAEGVAPVDRAALTPPGPAADLAMSDSGQAGEETATSPLAARIAAVESELFREVDKVLADRDEGKAPARLFSRLASLLSGPLADLDEQAHAVGRFASLPRDPEACRELDRMAGELAVPLAQLLDNMQVGPIRTEGDPILVDVHPVTNLQYFTFLSSRLRADQRAFLAPLMVDRKSRDNVWVEFQPPREIPRPLFGTMLDPLRGPPQTGVEQYIRQVGKRLPTRLEWQDGVAPAALSGDVITYDDVFERVRIGWTGLWYSGMPGTESAVVRVSHSLRPWRCSFRLVDDAE